MSSSADCENVSVALPPSQQQQQIVEQIIYTTSDGFDIPPECETSCLMALEVQRLIQEESKKIDDDGAKSNSLNQQSQQHSGKHESDLQIDLVSTNWASLFKIHDESIKKQQQDENNNSKIPEKDDDVEETKKSTSDQHQQFQPDSDEANDNDDETWDEDNMIDGMVHSTSALGMEREETDQSQWKLEEIVLRRSVPVQYDDIDADVEDDDPRAVGHSPTSKKKAKKEFSYLCKWAPGGHCTTWELRSLLVDEGFGPQVDAYDLKIKEKGIRDKKDRVDEFKGPCEFGKIAARGFSDRIFIAKPGQSLNMPVPPIRPHEAFFEQLFPRWELNLEDAFRRDHLKIVCLARIAPKVAADAFISHLREFAGGDAQNGGRSKHVKPPLQITFHGTSVAGIGGIIRRGLVRPGKFGVKMITGKVHGTVIYSGETPAVSVDYDRTGMQLMFGCVGIPTPEHTHGKFVCFEEEEKVCPVWLIHYTNADGGSRDTKNQFRVAPSAAAVMDSAAAANHKLTTLPSGAQLFGVPHQDDLLPKYGMSSHKKKLLRQTRQILGLERISM